MKFKYLFLALLFISSTPSFAKQCWNAKGKNVVDSVHYNLLDTFFLGENAAGQINEVRPSYNITNLQVVCEERWKPSPMNVTTLAYVTDRTILETEGKYM